MSPVPYIFAPDTMAKSEEVNANFTAVLAAIGGGAVNNAVRVYNDADQNVATGATVSLNFNQELYDTNGFHSTSSNTNRLTVPGGGGGVYQVFGGTAWTNEGTAAGRLSLQCRLNGTTNIWATDEALGSMPDPCFLSFSFGYKFAAGDYIELRCYQDSGVTRKVITSARTSPDFGMHFVALG
jgi:hypothetical protein